MSVFSEDEFTEYFVDGSWIVRNRSEVKWMAIFVSDELRLGMQLEELGVFDSLMDEDSNFFINIIRLRDTKVPECYCYDWTGSFRS